MKTLMIASALLALASNAMAKETVDTFVCKTADKAIDETSVTTIRFGLIKLGDEKVNYYVANEEENPVKTTPAKSHLSFLNDNWQVNQTNDGLELKGDGDGIEYP